MAGILTASDTAGLRLYLLGGFRVERDGHYLPDSAWPRSSAKTLIEALAVEPSHHLHREQLQNLLWPHLASEAAHINFRQALRTARLTLQPDVPRGAPSSFLRFADDIVTLLSDAA